MFLSQSFKKKKKSLQARKSSAVWQDWFTTNSMNVEQISNSFNVCILGTLFNLSQLWSPFHNSSLLQ